MALPGRDLPELRELIRQQRLLDELGDVAVDAGAGDRRKRAELVLQRRRVDLGEQRRR